MARLLLRKRVQAWLLPVLAGLITAGYLPAAEARKVREKSQEIAGSAEFLRSVPKRFATLKGADPARRRVTLLIEGEGLAKIWPLTPDAEVKVAGWWGRLDQLKPADRVWAWFKTDRSGQPVGIFMLADELSEQDIHGPGVTVVSQADGKLTLKPSRGANRTLKGALAALPTGSKVYVQSSSDQVRTILNREEFEEARGRQQAALRKRWLHDGLPGTVTFLHLSGEMDYMLDHEAMRWGRSLKPGDSVSLRTATPIPAVVKEVRPWRERTQLRLVMAGADQADLHLGQRVGLKMTAPPAGVEASPLPPDLGRFTKKHDRVEWFLASIYCTCGVAGDGCTGHFYTLASCNPNACGMPNHMRKIIAQKIDKGLTDKQIFEELLKEHGTDLVRPHLMP
jgi:hypothetical protein